jgi:hypothetical protein
MRAPIKNYDVLKGFVRAFTKMEVFFLANMKREISFEPLGSHAQFIVKYAGYIGYGDLLSVAKRHGLHVSMRYTKEFYVSEASATCRSIRPFRLLKRSINGWRLVKGLLAAIRARSDGASSEKGLLPVSADMSIYRAWRVRAISRRAGCDLTGTAKHFFRTCNFPPRQCGGEGRLCLEHGLNHVVLRSLVARSNGSNTKLLM